MTPSFRSFSGSKSLMRASASISNRPTSGVPMSRMVQSGTTVPSRVAVPLQVSRGFSLVRVVDSAHRVGIGDSALHVVYEIVSLFAANLGDPRKSG